MHPSSPILTPPQVIRSRPNLHIASEAFVRRVVMQQPGKNSPPGSLPRATAIEVDLNSGERISVFADKEVRLDGDQTYLIYENNINNKPEKMFKTDSLSCNLFEKKMENVPTRYEEFVRYSPRPPHPKTKNGATRTLTLIISIW